MVLSFGGENGNNLSYDGNSLSYEIFSMLENKFLFGYDWEKKGSPMPTKSNASGGGKVCILSIDGGGMRGIVAGRTLAYLEAALKEKSGDPNARICDYFDVATGTGVGGLLTAMLFTNDGTGAPLCRAEQTWRFLAEKGENMYQKSRGLFSKVFGGQRLSTRSVENVLKNLFFFHGRDLTLKDTLKPVLIPCYDLSSSAPFLFSRADALETDNFDFALWEVCRATGATPGFFRPVKMSSVDGHTKCTAVDGGLVMNNPTAAAITHVLHNKQEFPFVKGVEDLLVLSVGSGQFDRGYGYEEVKGWGALQWAKPIMKIVAEGVSDTVDHAISLAFGEKGQKNYVRIQASDSPDKTLGDVDDPSAANVKMLMGFADKMLQQKSMESVPFGGKKKLTQTNAERLDWFAEQLVLERQSRASRTFPTVLLKQHSPRTSLTVSSS